MAWWENSAVGATLPDYDREPYDPLRQKIQRPLIPQTKQ